MSEVLGAAVQFRYACLDRIVLLGYLTGLQRPEQLDYFFRAVVGIGCIEPSVLAGRTATYRAWAERYTGEQGIPFLASSTGARKEELVRPCYGRLGPRQRIACLLTSLESSRTFISYVPQRPPRSGDPNYRRIEAGRKRCLHYYWYVWDPVMGPMSLRVGTYLPITLTCYLNGHHFVSQALHRQGVAVYQEDNAILSVADPAALQAIADELTPAVLQARCDYWAHRLAPQFSPAERAALDLRYRYSVAQAELATDVIFRRPSPLPALFRRAVELGLLLGGVDRAAHPFGRQITRRYRGKLLTVPDRRNEGHPVLRSYYRTSFVKQYEKAETLLRTETCLNDPYHLGVGRRLDNLPELVARMAETSQRYLDAQAELLASVVDQREFARLAQPVQAGQRRVPGLRLQDDRLIRLLDVLLHPGTFVADWTTRDALARILARHRLPADGDRPSQLRYDLRKLRAHGLVQRLGRTQRYRLTARGLKLGVLLVKLRTRLLGPPCHPGHRTDPAATDDQPKPGRRCLPPGRRRPRSPLCRPRPPCSVNRICVRAPASAYRQILQTHPHRAEALHLLGLVAHQTGKHDVAADLIRRAIALDPHDPNFHNNLGGVLRNQGRLEEAVESLRRALGLDSGHADAHHDLGSALADSGELEQAAESFRGTL